jgi:hypothetical protein
VLRGSHGDVAGVEPGASFAERSVSEHGNRCGAADVHAPSMAIGWVHRRLNVPGRGGAAVVVRGRESRSHGQGRQWFREEIGGCNAERSATEW